MNQASRSLLAQIFVSPDEPRLRAGWRIALQSVLLALLLIILTIGVVIVGSLVGYDLSSLEVAIYGGQQVPRVFLEKLAEMAPRIGTGLGLTEAAGFCTYTAPGAAAEELAANIGRAMPVYPLSIRAETI